MSKKPIILTMFGTLIFLGLPLSNASALTPERSSFKENSGDPQVRITIGAGPPRRRVRVRGRTYWGYRNYGQFRRMQVGNRRYRYRTFPEYYMVGDRRRVRYVRYYYYY